MTKAPISSLTVPANNRFRLYDYQRGFAIPTRFEIARSEAQRSVAVNRDRLTERGSTVS